MVDRLVFALVQMLASELGDCFPMVSLREPDEEVEEEEILVQGDKALSIFKEIITLSQELVEPFTEGPFINQAE